MVVFTDWSVGLEFGSLGAKFLPNHEAFWVTLDQLLSSSLTH